MKFYIIVFILLSTTVFIGRSNECRILVLSGGGAHGAYQAGVIKRLDESGHKWDIITGISVGSLNGVFISGFSLKNQSLATKLLKSFWFNISDHDVYTKNWNPIWSGSVYDNNPLNQTIRKVLNNINGIKRDVLVGSTRVNDGKLVVFNRTDMIYKDDIIDILMASTAIPIYFPPKEFKGSFYMDGGLFTNELIYPAVRTCRKQGLTDIIIDVIRCSTPLKNVSSETIAKDNIFKLSYRTYEIASNTLFHHELYSACDTKKLVRIYPMYVYQPYSEFPGGLLDFDHDKVVTAYEMGYNTTKPIKLQWCH
jgi:predicted acylesterase/phospholipase RssA